MFFPAFAIRAHVQHVQLCNECTFAMNVHVPSHRWCLCIVHGTVKDAADFSTVAPKMGYHVCTHCKRAFCHKGFPV